MTPDAGESLVEIVIAIAIVGVAFVALLGGVLLTSSISGLHRNQADGNTQLISAIEQVKVAPYQACATTYTTVAVASGWSTNQAVAYWDATLNGGAGGFGTTCYDTHQPSSRTQRIVLDVTSADGRVTRTETFLKRG